MFNLNDQLNDIFLELDGKKAEIIRLCYGFETDASMNFRETGEVIGITKQRVQAAEEAAFEKMEEHVICFWYRKNAETSQNRLKLYRIAFCE